MRERVLNGTAKPDGFDRGVHAVVGAVGLVAALTLTGISLFGLVHGRGSPLVFFALGALMGVAGSVAAVRTCWQAAFAPRI